MSDTTTNDENTEITTENQEPVQSPAPEAQTEPDIPENTNDTQSGSEPEATADSGSKTPEESVLDMPDDEFEKAHAEEKEVKPEPEAKPKSRKRHQVDRNLSPEEQAQVDANIKAQTENLTPEDYENAYKDLLKPLWARGHNFTPRNIDEVKTLMSQGVDYLYKTQQLAQYRKQIDLLKRENISDDDLTFMVDLKKGNTEAIKKYFADHKINPYDIDTTEEVHYQPQTHMESDAALALRDRVSDLFQQPDGKKCYDSLVNDLDIDSQNYFLKEPDLLKTLYEHQHIMVGNNKSLYNVIKDEIAHQKMLGNIAPNTTFLEAYRTVGNSLLQQSGQAGNNQPSGSATAPSFHQRLGSVKNGANVSDRVRSAGVSPRSKAVRTTRNVSPFDMPDDEFLKQFDGRL